MVWTVYLQSSDQELYLIRQDYLPNQLDCLQYIPVNTVELVVNPLVILIHQLPLMI
jgi:hypothetical protein